MRIVLDTNCLLQILGAHSKYHFLFNEFLGDGYILCVSTDILFEYEEILKQKASVTAADLFLKIIAKSKNVIRRDPFFRFGLVKRDLDDNKFVDCAIVSQADYIVTDDNHFQDVEESAFPVVPIISLDAFAELMNSNQQI
jgi:putative PIN family toxin of toxin-antitoxin system